MPHLAIVKPDHQPAADLRAELRAAIDHRDAMDVRHRIAKEVVARAEEAKCVAAMDAERLKQGLDTEQAAATQRYARALSEALRGGSELPALPAMPEANSQALTIALARLSALHQSTCELETEAAAAAAKAADDAADVDRIIEDILDREGRALADEAVKAMQAHWKALDRLTGLIRLDVARSAPRLRELQEEVIGQVDRRKFAIAGNPLMVELHNWNGYLESLRVDAERIWQGFRARLRRDADAQLDVE